MPTKQTETMPTPEEITAATFTLLTLMHRAMTDGPDRHRLMEQVRSAGGAAARAASSRSLG